MSEVTSQPKKQKLWMKIGVPVAALLIGIGMGSSGKDVERVEVPGPERIVEVEVPVETGVPDVCLTALTKADEGFEYSAEGFGYASDAIVAVSQFDVEGIESTTAKINNLTPKMNQALMEYVVARDECRVLA